MAIRISREPFPSTVADALIAALNAELTQLYPEPGATHFRLEPEEVAPGRGAYVIAYHDGAAVGCGAIRRVGPGTGELKRMYVAPQVRGRGIGRALVEALEREARQLDIQRLVLETGVRQAAALALYRRIGFIEIPAFGEYQASPTSVCMSKDLD
jgi:GNAT superfamily N-acetyltransferase